jgi:hypothetical protein
MPTEYTPVNSIEIARMSRDIAELVADQNAKTYSIEKNAQAKKEYTSTLDVKKGFMSKIRDGFQGLIPGKQERFGTKKQSEYKAAETAASEVIEIIDGLLDFNVGEVDTTENKLSIEKIISIYELNKMLKKVPAVQRDDVRLKIHQNLGITATDFDGWDTDVEPLISIAEQTVKNLTKALGKGYTAKKQGAVINFVGSNAEKNRQQDDLLENISLSLLKSHSVNTTENMIGGEFEAVLAENEIVSISDPKEKMIAARKKFRSQNIEALQSSDQYKATQELARETAQRNAGRGTIKNIARAGTLGVIGATLGPLLAPINAIVGTVVTETIEARGQRKTDKKIAENQKKDIAESIKSLDLTSKLIEVNSMIDGVTILDLEDSDEGKNLTTYIESMSGLMANIYSRKELVSTIEDLKMVKQIEASWKAIVDKINSKNFTAGQDASGSVLAYSIGMKSDKDVNLFDGGTYEEPLAAGDTFPNNDKFAVINEKLKDSKAIEMRGGRMVGLMARNAALGSMFKAGLNAFQGKELLNNIWPGHNGVPNPIKVEATTSNNVVSQPTTSPSGSPTSPSPKPLQNSDSTPQPSKEALPPVAPQSPEPTPSGSPKPLPKTSEVLGGNTPEQKPEISKSQSDAFDTVRTEKFSVIDEADLKAVFDKTKIDPTNSKDIVKISKNLQDLKIINEDGTFAEGGEEKLKKLIAGYDKVKSPVNPSVKIDTVDIESIKTADGKKLAENTDFAAVVEKLKDNPEKVKSLVKILASEDGTVNTEKFAALKFLGEDNVTALGNIAERYPISAKEYMNSVFMMEKLGLNDEDKGSLMKLFRSDWKASKVFYQVFIKSQLDNLATDANAPESLIQIAKDFGKLNFRQAEEIQNYIRSVSKDGKIPADKLEFVNSAIRKLLDKKLKK